MEESLKQIGEFGLLGHIEKWLKGASIPQSDVRRFPVVLGIGDDCAAISVDDDHLLLMSTDILVEGVHFNTAYFTPEELGRRALAVNMSDIAAMGGVPAQGLIGLALPRSTPLSFIEGLYKGLTDTGMQYGIQIVGGDTVLSPGEVMLSVSILGFVERDCIVTRKGAKPGDLIMVTGTLGGASMGLDILEEMEKSHATMRPGQDELSNQGDRECRRSSCQEIIDRFLVPMPRIKEGRAVAKNHLVTSMIDLSDSLSQTLYLLARSSDIGIKVNKPSIPITCKVRELIRQRSKEPHDYALAGGEDYELLFTIRAENEKRVRETLKNETGVQVTVIGEIVPKEEGILLADRNGSFSELVPTGFEHF